GSSRRAAGAGGAHPRAGAPDRRAGPRGGGESRTPHRPRMVAGGRRTAPPAGPARHREPSDRPRRGARRGAGRGAGAPCPPDWDRGERRRRDRQRPSRALDGGLLPRAPRGHPGRPRHGPGLDPAVRGGRGGSHGDRRGALPRRDRGSGGRDPRGARRARSPRASRRGHRGAGRRRPRNRDALRRRDALSPQSPRIAPVEADFTSCTYLPSTPLVNFGGSGSQPTLRAASSESSTSRSSAPVLTSSRIRSPSRTKAIGPPSTASGAMWPTHSPVVPPEKRPSVISSTSLPRPAPLIAPVIASISRMPGPPLGPS